MSKWLQVRSELSQTAIESVAVKTVATKVRFGAYFPHGSKIPGALDSYGASSREAPLLPIHAKTDQVYGAQCA